MSNLKYRKIENEFYSDAECGDSINELSSNIIYLEKERLSILAQIIKSKIEKKIYMINLNKSNLVIK